MGDSPIIGKSGTQPAMVVSQPYVFPADSRNPHPSTGEISDFMRGQGFEPTPKSYFGWERPADGVRVLDARQDDFIKTSKGVVPVDLVMDQNGPVGDSLAESGSPAAAAADNVPANSGKLTGTRKATDGELDDILGKDWHKKDGKGKFARQFSNVPDYKKLGIMNPDIRIGPQGQIALQHPKDARKLFDTGLNLNMFQQ